MSGAPDVVLRSRRVLVDGALHPASVHLGGGRIVAVRGWEMLGHTARLVDHGELLITPGLVDTHVHVNEPGRADWEGFETATAAAAAGGVTTVVDMPLNCVPPTTSRAAAEAKLAALGDRLHVNVAFWGGLVPGNAGELAGLAAFGVAGVKCFLCPSGVDEFPHVGRADLEAALPVLRDLGLPLLVHAEAPEALARAARAVARAHADPRDYATFLRSRPARAEDEAIAMLIELARAHRAKVHVVHLASASALPLLAAAQARGVTITAETCPHYLTFAAEEIGAGATALKCAPPIRDAANREALWGGLTAGTISMVVSDHSPCTPALKRLDSGDFMKAWGGIASLQLGLPALFTEAARRGHGPVEVSAWSSAGPARLAGLDERKGWIAPGFDADLVVWDDRASFTVEERAIRHRHPLTPYTGRTLTGAVVETWVGGRLAYSRAGGLAPRPAGSFIAPRH